MVAAAEFVVKLRFGWAASRLLRLLVVSHFWTVTAESAEADDDTSAMVTVPRAPASAAAIAARTARVLGFMIFPSGVSGLIATEGCGVSRCTNYGAAAVGSLSDTAADLRSP